jgi:DNA-directed RNA polymerase specialized sigma24 family protein
MTTRDTVRPFPDSYGDLRLTLVMYLRGLGSAIPEELADETILRLLRKMGTGEIIHDAFAYAYRIAHHVFQESIRRPKMVSIADDYESKGDGEEAELLDECLTVCMKRLTSSERWLIKSYHEGRGQSLIDNRARLAKHLGISVEVLRLRVFQIRKRLRECIEECRRQRDS